MIHYPCDFIDKGTLALTDNARGCSVTPTWQLVVKGALDPAHVRAALADVAARFPSLRCKMRALDRDRRFEWVEDPAFTVDAIFRVVDTDDLAALAQEEQNRPLDPLADFPVTLTLARASDALPALLPPASRDRRRPRLHRPPGRVRGVSRDASQRPPPSPRWCPCIDATSWRR